ESTSPWFTSSFFASSAVNASGAARSSATCPATRSRCSWSRGFVPARRHETEVRRRDLEQLRDAREDAFVRQLVEVVEHQHDGLIAVQPREYVADRSSTGPCRRRIASGGGIAYPRAR